MGLEVLDWGLIEYEKALHQQLELVNKVDTDGSEGFLVFCTHPAVVTLGRATKPGDVFDWSGPQIEVSRGGRATYHGPSQLVIYPIVNIKNERKGRQPQEVQGFLRDFESALVKTLSHYGISSMGRSLQKKLNAEFLEEETGVWVETRKVASLGLAIKKWITYHGAALNVDFDSKAFQGMKPCGFSNQTMVSLEEILKQKIDRKELQNILETELLAIL